MAATVIAPATGPLLDLTRPGLPKFSVLMPLYGRAELARMALAALDEHTREPFEVIVVDNASPDGGLDELEATVSGIRLIRNPLNVGFGPATTLAALHARSELLLLLNSDVIVGPGWLPPLLETLASDPAVAAVSPALDNAGSVREVGSWIARDGSTHVIACPDDWERWRPRSVPYASAACLLIRRSVFCAVGGFDAVYPRGYYEDVELAFELRARGQVVMCDPRSVVSHLRGGSSGQERARQIMQHNATIFRGRWHHELSQFALTHRFRPVRDRDSCAVDRVLLIDDRVAHVDRGSGDPRQGLLLTRMAQRFRAATVTLLAADQTRAQQYAPALLAAGVEVADCSSISPEQWLESRRGHYSAVIVSRPHNVQRFRSLIDRTQPQAIRVVDVEAIDALRLGGQARLFDALGDPRARRLEIEASRSIDLAADSWRWADVVVCVSDDEAAIVANLAPDTERVVVSWAGLEAHRPVARAERAGLVFLGGFMSGEDAPNVDAVHHLVHDVLPIVRSRIPAVTLDIAGADPTPSVIACAGPGVQVLGRVDAAADELARHLVHVAPLRFGAGIKLKLIDSMTAGTPFVTTPVGAEGLHLGPLTDLLVAESADDLAALTERLLVDADAWQAAHDGLRAVAAEHFGPDAFDRSVDRLMARLGALR